MAAAEGMETLDARLASFVTKTTGSGRRRASNTKGSKTLSWPHRTPSPEDLAQAGFYFKPSPSSPDNCVCFICDRKLDGWEEEDDPFAEHLKHSANCAWALSMSPYIEGDAKDPTTSKMMDARRETFAGRWPHEGKRGWVCKTEKMVEAGWHYAPTPESDDSVTCAHCKLSLDGWEPKDNPFNEHYRRSPDCRFFSFAGTTAPKATKGKKGRHSKASRLSTQSNVTATSEAPSIPDLEDSIDQTILSQDTVISTASKAPARGGKGGKGKGKGSKAKNAEPVVVEECSVIEPDAEDMASSKIKRGKKRTSEQISDDDDDGRKERESTVRPEPPPKRRATRTRISVAEEVQYPILSLEPTTDFAEPKPAKGGRKRASSRVRKVSTASTASKASLRARVPDDSAIEAELAAELERPLSDEEMDMNDVPVTDSQGKGGKAKAAASTASVRQPPAEVSGTVDFIEIKDESMQVEDSQIEQTEKMKKKGKAAKGRGKKKGAAKHDEVEVIADETLTVVDKADPVTQPAEQAEPVVSKPEEDEADTEMTEAPKAKKGGKKKAGPRSKTQKPKQKMPDEQGLEDGTDETTEHKDAEDDQQFGNAIPESLPHNKEPDEACGIMKKPQRSIPGASEPEEVSALQTSPVATREPAAEQQKPEVASGSPQIAKRVATPSPSPQPSDAENQPPSSRPSATRPPLLPMSPSATQALRVPLATTPKQSPSKMNRPVSGLTTSYPWTSVDVEMIFTQTPGNTDKENVLGGVSQALTSLEKQMSVEEWVFEMAKKVEGQFKEETERVVGIFEKEGSRAMKALEGIECTD